MGVGLRVSAPPCRPFNLAMLTSAFVSLYTLPTTRRRAYDRLTPALASFLEGLTAVHEANQFHKFAEATGQEAFTGVRGHPANDGPDFQTVHPVIRTNPVTGWCGLFVNPG